MCGTEISPSAARCETCGEPTFRLPTENGLASKLLVFPIYILKVIIALIALLVIRGCADLLMGV